MGLPVREQGEFSDEGEFSKGEEAGKVGVCEKVVSTVQGPVSCGGCIMCLSVR